MTRFSPMIAIGLVALTALAFYLLSTAPAQADDDARKVVKSLSTEELEQLRRNQERFAKLPPKEQMRIRTLHEKLRQHDKAEHLSRVLEKYSTWLRSLPAGKRAELLALPREERLKRMSAIIAKQERDRFLRLATDDLRSEDSIAILSWIRELALARRDALLKLMPPPVLSKYNAEETSESDKERMLAFTLFTHPEALKISGEEFARLEKTLSDSAQQAVAKVDNLEDKANVIKTWVRIAFFSRMTHRSREPVPEEKLTEYYDSLDPSRQEYLRNLPSEQMKRELESMYHNRKWLGSRGWPSGRSSRGFGGGRGIRPGPGGRGNFGGNRRPPGAENRDPSKPTSKKSPAQESTPKKPAANTSQDSPTRPDSAKRDSETKAATS